MSTQQVVEYFTSAAVPLICCRGCCRTDNPFCANLCAVLTQNEGINLQPHNILVALKTLDFFGRCHGVQKRRANDLISMAL